MNNASLYSNNNFIQKQDAHYTIHNYLHLMKWHNHQKILDVGCGDGGVTFDLLLPKLPHVKKLVCLDINENMLRLAKSKSHDNPKVKFVQMDIGSAAVPEALNEHFDHIFSFTCLHWVANQRQTIQNMFNLLYSGGDFLLCLIANHPMFDVYKKMETCGKWAPYMTDLHRILTLYQQSDQAARAMKQFLEDVGFVDYRCEVIDRSCAFRNSSEFWNFASAINPFFQRISEQELESYKKDYFKELRTVLKNSSGDKTTEEKICIPYQLLVAFASKPL